MSKHNILSKVDSALATFLTDTHGIAHVYAAKRADDLPNPPFVTCFAENGSVIDDLQYSGNYTVKVSIDVHTNAAPDVSESTEDMVLDSDALVAAVFSPFFEDVDDSSDKLCAAINSTAQASGIEVTFLSCMVRSVEQGRGEKVGEWVDGINLEILAAPSNIS